MSLFVLLAPVLFSVVRAVLSSSVIFVRLSVCPACLSAAASALVSVLAAAVPISDVFSALSASAALVGLLVLVLVVRWKCRLAESHVLVAFV